MSKSPPDPGVPAHVDELAAACVEYVRRAVGTTLDGTPETLPLLDHYLGGLDTKDPGPVLELIVSAAGAYFGEIVRRRFPCGWFAPPGEPFRWRIEFERVFLHFNPVAIAFEAIARRDSGLGAAFETFDADEAILKESLARLPPVRQRDFFTLSVRLEVLDRVVAELTALTVTRGDRVNYGAEDYRAIIDGLRH